MVACGALGSLRIVISFDLAEGILTRSTQKLDRN
jgi:hypothetical protein